MDAKTRKTISRKWGGYRRGFLAHTEFALKDFGIDFNLGPAARTIEMTLAVEGIKQ